MISFMVARSNGYGEDLAYVHHVAYGDFARLAGEPLLAMLRRWGIISGLIVDLGSGSGIWARRLVDANYSVLGVDASAAMVELARRQVPEARFVEASFVDVRLPLCDAVTAMGEVLSYAFDRRNGRAALGKLFQRSTTRCGRVACSYSMSGNRAGCLGSGRSGSGLRDRTG